MTQVDRQSSLSGPGTWRVLAVLALRNLRRNVRRTVLTAVAMILGGIMLILAFSMSDGGQEMWIGEAARMGSGHITIEHPDFRTAARIDNLITEEVGEAVLEVLSLPEIARLVVAGTTRISVSGLASSAAGARPVRISAVDPDAEAMLSGIDARTVKGRYLEQEDGALAYVGEQLASNLRLDPGSKFVVQAEDTNGEIASELLRVAGIFRSGVAEIDQATVQIPLATADAWLGADGGVSNFKLVLVHSSAVPGAVAAIEEALDQRGSLGQVAVLGWKEANPALASAIALDDFSGWIVQVLLFTIIAFAIMNAVLMSVLYRQREFGILRAIGLMPGQTGALVLIEGMVLTLASGLIGVGLGALLVWYFFGNGLDLTGLMDQMTFSGVMIEPVIVPEFRLVRFAHSLGFILVVGMISSVYPAARAARIEIVEVLQFDR